MIPVLTAADVERQDAAAAERGMPVDRLMRAAGAAVASSAVRLLGRAYGRHIAVICGKGNNAGDGLVAARYLARRGAGVRVVLTAGDPRDAAGRALRAFDGPTAGPEGMDRALRDADLAIDALLGVGLSRAPEGAIGDAVRSLNSWGGPVLAVDVPSGLDADTGAVPGDAVLAGTTVTFTGFKPGLLFASGAALAGTIEIAGIGVPADIESWTAIALEGDDVRAMLPSRAPAANKYRSGVALIVAGSRAMPGAASLVSGACVRAGAGLTVLASPASVCAIAVQRTPEIVTVPLAEGFDGVFDEKGLEPVRERLGRASALAVGPGLTTHPATVEAVRALVAESSLPLVLDADGLNAFEGAIDLLQRRRAPAVLTPHAGEFERLAGAAAVDRLRDTRGLAERTGCVVLLKGAGSVIASPDGRLAVNPTGGPSLASAGTGDVLTGIIAAFLARGLDPFDAAAAAAFVHGRAGDLAGAVPASDLIDLIPAILGA